MKYIIATMILILSCSVFSEAKWDKRSCGKIELGVSQLSKATGSLKDLADRAGKNGDSVGEEKFRDQQLFYLASAGHWASIYSAFCKE